MSGRSVSFVAACVSTSILLASWGTTESAAASGADRLRAPAGSSIIILREQLAHEPVRDGSAAPTALPKALRGWDVYDALRSQARATQSEVITWLESQALTYRSLWVANMIQVEAPVSELADLESWPAVDRIVVDASLRIEEPIRTEEPQVPARRFIEWNVDLIDAPSVWSAGGERNRCGDRSDRHRRALGPSGSHRSVSGLGWGFRRSRLQLVRRGDLGRRIVWPVDDGAV